MLKTREAHDRIDVPINVPVNERRKWKLEQLAAGSQPKASDLAARFGVTEKTAKRDIALLKAQGLIEFVGAAKKGHYRLTQPDARSHQP